MPFVFINNFGELMESADGVTWTKPVLTGAPPADGGEFVNFGGRLILFQPSTGGGVYFTTTGIEFATVSYSTLSPPHGFLHGAADAVGAFCAGIATAGNLIRTADGSAYALISKPSTPGFPSRVRKFSNRIVLLDFNGAAYVSTDGGATWGSNIGPISGNANDRFVDILYIPGVDTYIAVGYDSGQGPNDGRLFRKVGAGAWTQIAGTFRLLHSVAYDGSTIMVGGDPKDSPANLQSEFLLSTDNGATFINGPAITFDGNGGYPIKQIKYDAGHYWMDSDGNTPIYHATAISGPWAEADIDMYSRNSDGSAQMPFQMTYNNDPLGDTFALFWDAFQETTESEI